MPQWMDSVSYVVGNDLGPVFIDQTYYSRYRRDWHCNKCAKLAMSGF